MHLTWSVRRKIHENAHRSIDGVLHAARRPRASGKQALEAKTRADIHLRAQYGVRPGRITSCMKPTLPAYALPALLLGAGHGDTLSTFVHVFDSRWSPTATRTRTTIACRGSPKATPLYFEQLIVLHAGLAKRDEFYEEYAELIDSDQHQPGCFQQSAADASFDKWIAVGGERARSASVDISSTGQVPCHS